MGGKTKILFTDTNGFLQVRDLKDVPWKELFPGVKAVDVMVAPSVIDELDKHKTSNNQRRRDRARLALKLIEQASRAPDFALVLRDDPIRVRIVISIAPRFDWSKHPTLDSANPDDQLVAEALSFGNGAAVLSYDTGPLIRARVAKIEAYQPPPIPKWLLPDEQTDDRREIAKLKRDLNHALSQRPNIIAGFKNFDEATSEIRIIVPIVRPLNSQQVDRLAGEYLAKHPRASVLSDNASIAWQVGRVSEPEAQRYHADYSSFQARVREYYERLHEHVQRIGAVAAIDYSVKNESGVLAEGLRIEFDLEGNGSLIAEREEAPVLLRGLFKIPTPPIEPGSILPTIAPVFHNRPTLQDHLKPIDPVAFRWFKRPKLGSTHSAHQCQEFRATREYRDTIFAVALDELPTELGLRLHIEAANLPSPVNIAAKVIIAEQAVEWSDPVVQSVLPDHIGELV